MQHLRDVGPIVISYVEHLEWKYSCGWKTFPHLKFASKEQLWHMHNNGYNVTKKMKFLRAAQLGDTTLMSELHMKLRKINFDGLMMLSHIDAIEFIYKQNKEWVRTHWTDHLTQREDVYNWKLSKSHMDNNHLFDQAIVMCDVERVRKLWDEVDIWKTEFAHYLPPPKLNPRYNELIAYLDTKINLFDRVITSLLFPEDRMEAALRCKNWIKVRELMKEYPDIKLPIECIEEAYDIDILNHYDKQYTKFNLLTIQVSDYDVLKWRLDHGMQRMKLDQYSFGFHVAKNPCCIVKFCLLLHWPINQRLIQLWLKIKQDFNALWALENILVYARAHKIPYKIPYIKQGGDLLRNLTMG